MAEYIKREAVMKVLEEYYPGVDERLHIVKDITSIPAADVAPVRHGRWLKRSDGTPYCSICGANERDTYEAVMRECKYCYSCGALMDGKEDNIDGE